MSIFDPLDVEPIINACGPVTRLGGAPMPTQVIEAMRRTAEGAASLEQLQTAAGQHIARHTGAESGLVTAGAAAALTLGAAALLAGQDLARMERLPDTAGMPNEFVVAREQRSGYDHAVRAAGAQLVEVGFNELVSGAGVRRTEPWEIEAAITDRTAGILYVATSDSRPPLEAVAEIARRTQTPILVDAAGQLPPRENLTRFIAAGADLVCFSGGKGIRGPQSTGILCGRESLIQSAAMQMLDMDDHPELFTGRRPRPRHGLGRAMKVSKEGIVGLCVALELFASGQYDRDLPTMRSWLDLIGDALQHLPTTCHIAQSHPHSPPILTITLAQDAPLDAMELCRQLRQTTPPIYVGHAALHQRQIQIHPLCLRPGESEQIAQRLSELLAHD